MGLNKQNCWCRKNNVVDWLRDIGMVVKSTKTQAIYFSKHDQVGLNTEVGSIKMQVGTSMSVGCHVLLKTLLGEANCACVQHSEKEDIITMTFFFIAIKKTSFKDQFLQQS